MYRADETSINRGNVNLVLPSLEARRRRTAPAIRSPLHPGTFHRVQIVVPGQSPLPGSVSGVTGTPASQAAGHAFSVTIYATDDWWNPLPSADQRAGHLERPGFTAVSGALNAGSRSLSVTLETVGSQTLTVNDQTNGSIQGSTSAPIMVILSAADHFAFTPSPRRRSRACRRRWWCARSTRATTRSPTSRARPADREHRRRQHQPRAHHLHERCVVGQRGIPRRRWRGDAHLLGLQLAAPHRHERQHRRPARTLRRTSSADARRTAQGGTIDGKNGTPSGQTAGAAFTVTVRAVDAYWNLVSAIGDSIALGSDDLFARLPAETTLVNGQVLIPTRLYRTGPIRVGRATRSAGHHAGHLERRQS